MKSSRRSLRALEASRGRDACAASQSLAPDEWLVFSGYGGQCAIPREGSTSKVYALSSTVIQWITNG